ncbi:hypothetical protein N9M41_08230 [Rhodopirellula sp.]|nr:hypothetical protein [Rhodopirellula sp.]
MKDPRHGLAEFGSEIKLLGDDQLFQALVSGCHIENAAAIAGISVRTAYRRLADPVFKEQLQVARQSLRESILAKLSDAGHDAVGTLWELMQTAEDEGVRLRAAKAVLDSLRGFHAESPTIETTTRTRVESSRRVVERT